MMKYPVVIVALSFALIFAGGIEGAVESNDSLFIQSSRNQTYDNSSTEPVWTHLERMDLEKRENSRIYLVLEPDANREAIRIAGTIENLWNNGAFEMALDLFPTLANLTDVNELAIGNAWREPVATLEQPDWGNDVRVGDRDSIFMCVLDRHTATGNLFAVVLLRTASVHMWTMNFSDDGGATWTETHIQWATYEMKTVDAVSLANHCYVAFVGGFQNQAFACRFQASDGALSIFPNQYYCVEIFTATLPDSIEEVTLWSNQDGDNDRLYCAALINSGDIRAFWADPDAVDWTDFITNITDAERGLDACSNDGVPTSRYLWLSYLSANDSLCVFANEASGWLQRMRIGVGSGSPRFTALGAYCDTIIVLYEYDPPVGLSHVRYGASYDAGSNWGHGPVGDVDTTHEAPAVSARLGGGQAVVYRYYTLPRELRFTWRDYAGAWTNPVVVAETEPYYNQPSIQYLGGNVHGVLFLSWHVPYEQAAYFTRSDWTTGVAEYNESHALAGYLSLAPNPVREHTCLSIATLTSGRVKITLYDVAGRLLRNIFDAPLEAGNHTVNIKTYDLSAGIYFVRVDSPDGKVTRAMTVVR